MTARFTDPHYLKNHQYKDSSNLEARQALHARFGANHTLWPAWLFAQIELEPGAIAIDVGCGPANLWAQSAGPLSETTTLIAGDLSIGMARAARRNLAGWRSASCLSLDAQALPFPSSAADAVMAFHMLYHVPDIPRALAEFRRVLRPGGKIYAATNGQAHMGEMYELIRGLAPDFKPPLEDRSPFSLENAADILQGFFEHVEVRPLPNMLVVTAVAPLRDYILSISSRIALEGLLNPAELDAYLEEEMVKNGGAIHIHTYAGLAIGTA